MDGTILRVNRTFERLTGHERAALLGQRFLDLLAPAGRDLPRDALPAAAADAGRRARDRARHRARRRHASAGAHQLRRNARTRRDGGGSSARRSSTRPTAAPTSASCCARAAASRTSPSCCSAACSPAAWRLSAALCVEVVYRPAQRGIEVGGDWYDAFWLDDERTAAALVVGDVVGHGIEAAAVMGQLRSAIRALAVDRPRARPAARRARWLRRAPPRRAHDDRRLRAARRDDRRAALRLRRPSAADAASRRTRRRAFSGTGARRRWTPSRSAARGPRARRSSSPRRHAAALQRRARRAPPRSRSTSVSTDLLSQARATRPRHRRDALERGARDERRPRRRSVRARRAPNRRPARRRRRHRDNERGSA